MKAIWSSAVQHPIRWRSCLAFLICLASLGVSGCQRQEEPAQHNGHRSAAQTGSATTVSVWPLPRQVKGPADLGLAATAFLALARDFKIVSECSKSAQLDATADRYLQLLFPRRLPSRKSAAGLGQQQQQEQQLSLKNISVCVEDASRTEVREVIDEEYELNVTSAATEGALAWKATLHARTSFGALHGLETFAQLVRRNPRYGEYGIENVPLMISDWPRFRHRGLLLDTARHHFPVGTILRTLDAMAATKMNVLHWHMTDGEALPIESKVLPEFWDAAWSESEVYTVEDIQEIVEFAASRGIRVVPELDVPGHSRAWFFVLPNLFPKNGCRTKWWAMDPSANETFITLHSLLQELTTSFPGALFHIGGDEVGSSVWGDVRFDCWHHLRAWAQDQGFTSFQEVLGHFMFKVLEMVQSMSKRPVVWDDVWRQVEDLPAEVIVQVWEDPKLIKAIAMEDHHSIIASPVGAWYLDDLDTSWRKMYTFEPLNGLDSDKLKDKVLGGEAALWAEKVDGSTLDAVVWPRAAAVAERLWAGSLVGTELLDAPMKIPEATVERLATFRCLLLERGIGASPLDGVGRAGLHGLGPSSCRGHSVLPIEQRQQEVDAASSSSKKTKKTSAQSANSRKRAQQQPRSSPRDEM